MRTGDYEDDIPVENRYTPHEGSSGSLHTVGSNNTPYDRVYALRQVVDDITRRRIPIPVKLGPRFI